MTSDCLHLKNPEYYPVLTGQTSVQFSSVAQSCVTLWDHMDCSTLGLPVHHQLPEFTQTHVHRVGDAIQPSHPLLSPSPASNLSQHWGLFQMSQFFTSGGQNIVVSASASVLPMNIQDWFPLGWTGWISLQSKGLSRIFSNTVHKHQFFGTQLKSVNSWSLLIEPYLLLYYFIILKYKIFIIFSMVLVTVFIILYLCT